MKDGRLTVPHTISHIVKAPINVFKPPTRTQRLQKKARGYGEQINRQLRTFSNKFMNLFKGGRRRTHKRRRRPRRRRRCRRTKRQCRTQQHRHRCHHRRRRRTKRRRRR